MIKVFVNVPATGTRKDWGITGKDRRGAEVQVSASAKALGKGPFIVKFWIEPEGNKNADPKFLAAGKRARVTKVLDFTTKDRFRSSAVLPHVGGDQYKVKVAKLSDALAAAKLSDVKKFKASDVFETWRRIYIHVHAMNPKCKALFAKMKPKIEAVFKKSFVEVKWEPASPSPTRVSEPWTPADPVGQERLFDGKKYRLTRKPLHMRLLIVNNLADAKEVNYGGTVGAGALKKGDLLVTTGDSIAPGYANQGCKVARVRTSAAGATPAGAWTDVKAHVRRTGAKKLALHLHRDKVIWAHLKAGNTVDVEVTVWERGGGFCGYSYHNLCVVRAKEAGGMVTVLQTFTHEVGHSLSMARSKEPLFDASGNATGNDEANADWYGDRDGGQGPHCHHNAKQVVRAGNPSGKGWDADGAKVLCTMFDRDDGNVDKAGAFCAACEPLLTRMDLSPTAQRGNRPGEPARANGGVYPPSNWDFYS